MRGVIRTDTDAVVELFLQGEDFKFRKEWLNIETDAFDLHVNWSKVSTAYFGSRPDKSYGLSFLDQLGHLVFRLSLTKQDGEFNPAQLQSYQQDWQNLVQLRIYSYRANEFASTIDIKNIIHEFRCSELKKNEKQMTEKIKPKLMDYKRHLLVCIGDRCTENGEGQALYNELKEKLKISGLNDGELRVKRSRATCFGTCKSGPLLCVQPDGVWYYDITSEKLDRIITEHFLEGKPVTEYVYHQA